MGPLLAGDLGRRMATVARRLPQGPLVIIGSDIPGISPAMIERAFHMVMAGGSKRIGILGLAFKAGTDDLRENGVSAGTNVLGGASHADGAVAPEFNICFTGKALSDPRACGHSPAQHEVTFPHRTHCRVSF